MLQPKQAVTAPPRRAKTSAWSVYARLFGYAWRYRTRLLLSVLFSLVITFSIVSIILGSSAFINVIFYTPSQPTAQMDATTEQDPAEGVADNIVDYAGWAASVAGIEPDQLRARVIDYIAQARVNKMPALQAMAVIVIVLAFVGGVSRYIQEYYAGSIGANISVTLGQEMFENIIRLPVGFFEQRSSGEIMARFSNDILMVNRGLAGVLVKVLREPIKAVVLLAVAFSTSVTLTLLGLCELPPVAFVILRIGKKIKKSVTRSLSKIASLTTVVNEDIKGILIVKAFSMEEHEIGRLRREIGTLRRNLVQMVKADALVGPLTEIILVLGLMAFMLVSGALVLRGSLVPADLIKLYGALALLLDPVRKLSTVNNQIQTSIASAERVFEFIDATSTITEAPNAVVLKPMSEALRFEDVTFSYDGKTNVLENIVMEVKRGEMVALVGYSGAGKSTLVKLIPRFYDCSSGRVTIDGVDIRSATFKSLRDQIGIVTQETYLFNMSIRENLAFGSAAYSDDRIHEAARAARADEFIRALPQGYDTVLGEGGFTLSGGQRQRLAIARALVKDPPILILDEATSSLDSESERAIQRALEDMVVGRTTIVIAHRLSTVQRADRILVLDRGCIVEEGTHAELLAKGGIYNGLYKTQFGGEDALRV